MPHSTFTKYLLLLTLCSLFASCVTETDDNRPWEEDEEIYVPIYGTSEDVKIKVMQEYPLTNPGKIYIYQDYLFVNEVRKGIHIIDNSTPETPKYLRFIRIPGNVDIAVKGNILYADHGADLVSIDISDIEAPEEVGRVKDLYTVAMTRPPQPGRFKCPDRDKIDMIIGWEKRIQSEDVNCYWYE